MKGGVARVGAGLGQHGGGVVAADSAMGCLLKSGSAFMAVMVARSGGYINCALTWAYARPFRFARAGPGGAVGPRLHTTRLLLRPLVPEGAPFHRLINDWEICRQLPDAPFPYPAELAAEWIAAASADREAGSPSSSRWWGGRAAP